jgi:hypothetical protein
MRAGGDGMTDEMTPYQSWEKSVLSDIGQDVDHIKEAVKMTNSDLGWVASMINNGKESGNWSNDLLIIVLLLILGGGNGLLGRGGAGDVAGVDRTVVNEANYSRLMDLINGNRDAVGQLAQTLNCDVGQITAALAGVDKQLAVNQGSIINAIQSCCCNVQNKVQECCCETNRNIERQGCQTRADIQETRFLISNGFAAQNQLMQTLASQNQAYLADQFCQIKTREDQREIQMLRDKLEDAKADARMVSILAAVNGRSSVSGTLDTTAGTWSGSVS